jgi:hypothetical protein
MSIVTLDQMRDRLLTIPDVEKVLTATEPLTSQQITKDSKVTFKMTDGWNADLEDVPDTEPVGVLMTIDGTERQMTKEGALMAAANVGLPGAYVRKAPADLIEPHLNYWYANPEKEYTALAVGEKISAFTRPTLVPFSNLDLLDSALTGIRQQYGQDTEVLADYKIFNTLTRTDMRLIVPEHQRTITGGGMADVPEGESDIWSAGIHLANGLTGKRRTSIDAYLFRWWCTNGSQTTLSDVGTWSRRTNGQEQDVYLWAQETVDEILGGMEERFTSVQALTSLNLAGNTADVLRQIFSEHDVPVTQRNQITDALLESETLTMYSVMNAITRTANAGGLSPERIDSLLRIGGSIPTATFDTIKAKVWAEGHTAPEQASNPYAIALN